jgi:hypothetical protein
LLPFGGEGVMARPATIDDCRLTIAPNPLTGSFATIRLSPVAIGHSPSILRVYDAAGRCVQSAICNLKSEMPLDLRGLSQGAYLVRVQVGGRVLTGKLVVE